MKICDSKVDLPEGGAASASRTNAQTPGAGITDLVSKQSIIWQKGKHMAN